MFSTASCVSQISWLHIQQKPRALSDLQAFDGASRGPAGAVAMLAFPTRYCVPAIVASLITLATLLMEPLSQQVLQFPVQDLVVLQNATYPTTQMYAPAPKEDMSKSHSSEEGILVRSCHTYTWAYLCRLRIQS